MKKGTTVAWPWWGSNARALLWISSRWIPTWMRAPQCTFTVHSNGSVSDAVVAAHRRWCWCQCCWPCNASPPISVVVCACHTSNSPESIPHQVARARSARALKSESPKIVVNLDSDTTSHIQNTNNTQYTTHNALDMALFWHDIVLETREGERRWMEPRSTSIPNPPEAYIYIHWRRARACETERPVHSHLCIGPCHISFHPPSPPLVLRTIRTVLRVRGK